MTRFKSEEEFQAFLANRDRGPAYFKVQPENLDISESALQSKIRTYSKAKGWPEPLIFRQTRAVIKLVPPGWPDCVIPIPHHILLVETKKPKTGKFSPAQKLTRLMFMALGLTIHEIRTYKAYMELVEKVTRRE